MPVAIPSGGVWIEAIETARDGTWYFVGGVGDLSVALDRNDQFLYLFFSQYGRKAAGCGVARMMWGDKDNPVGKLDVRSAGAWLPMRGSELTDATPIFLMTRLWHDADAHVDAYWGPTVHWNHTSRNT